MLIANSITMRLVLLNGIIEQYSAYEAARQLMYRAFTAEELGPRRSTPMYARYVIGGGPGGRGSQSQNPVLVRREKLRFVALCIHITGGLRLDDACHILRQTAPANRDPNPPEQRPSWLARNWRRSCYETLIELLGSWHEMLGAFLHHREKDPESNLDEISARLLESQRVFLAAFREDLQRLNRVERQGS